MTGAAPAGAYAERRSAALPGVVWTRTSHPGPFVVTPDGCMDLLWDGATLLVAGPDTGPVVAVHDRTTHWAAVRLDPGIAPSLLGLPARPLADERVRLEDLWPGPTVAAWTEAVADSETPADALEGLVADGLRAVAPPPGWVPVVAAALASGRTVAEAATELGVTERHLHRRCTERFGYGPKVLQRVLRLVAAQRDLRAGVPPAAAAVRHGYADQPHLHRELRRLTGSGRAAGRPQAQAGSGA